MSNKLLLSLGLIFCVGLAISVFAADRFVVCEELYQEG
jgi:hypothetical protein